MQWASTLPKEKPKKSWIRSIPGFRTGVWWKAVIAVYFYLCIALGILAAIFDPSHKSEPNTSATVVPTTVAVMAKATPEPTVEAPVLIARLDTMWAQSDWWRVIGTLEQLQQVAPGAMDYKDKLYAAHYFNGKDLLSKGITTDAATQFAIANQIDPSRTEAKEALLALTPTPTLASTPTPVLGKGDVIAAGNWAYALAGVHRLKEVQWSSFGNKTRAKGIWLVITMVVGNIGDRSMSLNEWDFELKDGDGRKYSMDTVTSSLLANYIKEW